MERHKPKQLVWVGSSLHDLKQFPEDVKDAFGYALYLAQAGGKHPAAKPLKGFSGAGVLEIVEGSRHKHVPCCLYSEDG